MTDFCCFCKSNVYGFLTGFDKRHQNDVCIEKNVFDYDCWGCLNNIMFDAYVLNTACFSNVIVFWHDLTMVLTGVSVV